MYRKPSLQRHLALAAALLLAACTTQQLDGATGEASSAALTGAVGTNHPASGQWSPVNEAGWSTATWGLGASFTAGEGSTLQVAVYSGNASKVVLEIYGQATGADALYDYNMQKGSDGAWRAAVALVPGKTLYAFRAWGPNWPFSTSWTRGNSAAGFQTDVDGSGNRFNPNKVLFDPYARELTHDVNGTAMKAAGENAGMFGTGGTDVSASQTYSGPITGNVAINRRNVDTARYAPKGVAFVDATSYGTKPNLPAKDAVIYEAHVRGLTAHPSSVNLTTLLSGMSFPDAQNVPDAMRGTYAGAGYMAGYLKDLGYTTIELLPIQDTDNDANPSNNPGGNYWGYMTYGFFAPDRHYAYDKSLGGPTREFKQMVKAFHDAGLEVYLDVVYNHTGEGGNWDSTMKSAQLVSFRGLDNQGYYALVGGNPASYWETTGCGNNFDASKAPVKTLIKDSLTYWASQMGVDGFRFDLAPVLGRDVAPTYNFNSGAQLLADIASQAAAGSYEVIAEAWDLGTYQVGSFPNGWGEWNGRYRDTVRQFITGNPAGNGGIGWADAFYGDQGHYGDQGGAQRTVNMIDAHDGFTLVDLVSYNGKTNASRAWPFGPSDGGNDSNLSYDWGGNQALRRQAVRNFMAFQAMSRGIPMLVYGDELGRTQNGNNNPYNIDSVATWNNYNMIATATPDAVPTGDTTGGTEAYHNDLGTFAGGKNQNFLFQQCLLQLRKAHPALRQADYSVPITFAKLDGSSGFNEYSDTMSRIYITGSSVGDSDFVVMVNMYSQSGTFTVPAAPAGKSWVRVVDTGSWTEGTANCWAPAAGAVISGSYSVGPSTIVVLQSYAPGGTAPAAPTGVTATAASSSQINVAWTASTGATSYTVYRGTSSSGPWTSAGTSSTASFAATGLSASTTYWFYVTASNSYGTSSASGAASAATPANPVPPSAPTGVTATAASSSQINVGWTASSGATSYTVYRGTSSSGPWTSAGTSTGTSLAATGLSASTTYWFYVTATNAAGTSPASATASATTPAQGYTSPYAKMYLRGTMSATTWDTSIPMTLVANNTWRVTVTLAASTAYQYKYDTGTWTSGQNWGGGAGGASGTAVVNGGNVAYTSGVAGTYTFQFNDSTLAYTVTAPAPSIPAAPTGVTASAASSSQINVSWTASSGATSYTVYRATSSTGTFTSVGTSTTTSFASTGLAASTTYYYRVTASNAAGASAQSATASATTPAAAFTKNYPTMYLRGTMNGWGTTAMTLVANNTWRVTVTLSPGTAYQYKFDTGSWTSGQNWGASGTAGIAAVNAGNIGYTTGSGTSYTFTFNDATLAYSVTSP